MILRCEFVLSKEQINYVARFRDSKQKQISQAARGFINACRDVCEHQLDKEFRVFVQRHQMDQQVGREALLKRSVVGISLLDKGDNYDESGVMTQKEFNKLKRLRQLELLRRIKGVDHQQDR